ncbi:hypothetical protein HDU83_000833 [Entophlyctis luteolus]|nr:hypothetical protein HDU82_001061 [Entophlyctis luteolus]KAJ3356483.1 hypothetical protein HDU83_000833 [Entophlyctis luteolus]
MFGGIRGVCIDLSGTLHVEDEITLGASAALSRLRSHPAGLQIRFVTNTTKESRALLEARLNRLGLAVNGADICSSLAAAATVVRNRNLRPFLLLEDSAKADFDIISHSDSDFDSVVVGLAPSLFDYENLSKAMNVLLEAKKRPGKANLIAIHKGRYFQSSAGLKMGPGPFVAALEYSTGIVAETVGKPEKAFFDIALDDMKLAPSECVMIGDDVRDDIGGAMSAGMKGILIQTGKYRLGDETAFSGIRPTAVAKNFSTAVDLILQSLEHSPIVPSK